ncbi:TPA: sulfurtransferase [Klebsiella pneumoniae]
MQPDAQLISVESLQQRLGQPGLVTLDCRFALDDPHYGARSHAAGHIPGAHFADLERHLSGPAQPGVSGRHPLPQPDVLIEQLRAWGIDNDSTIVLYDDGPNLFSARAWWLLAWLGKHSGVYLLDGGLRAWQAAGLPLSDAQPAPGQGRFSGQPASGWLLSADDLLQRLDDPQQTLLDARALPRFRGEDKAFDPVAGHIPGARCAPFMGNLDADGCFLSPQQLHARFAPLLEGRPLERLAVYCGSGVSACHNLFAMRRAGYPLAPLYAGSWSEWINDPERPVATGD